MKSTLSTLALYFIIIVAHSQNPVPNPGFENWIATEPDSWFTINNPPALSVTQTNVAYAGNYAVKGQPVVDQGQIILPYMASMPVIGQGFPIAQLYNEMSFYFKFNQGATDIMNATVIINDNLGNPIGGGSMDFNNTVPTFTQAIIPITYFGAGTPGTCIIIFVIDDQNGNGSPDLSSYYVVDNVLLSGVSSLPLTTFRSGIEIYPNPTTGNLNIKSESLFKHESTFAVYDNAGRKVTQFGFDAINSSLNNKQIDLS